MQERIEQLKTILKDISERIEQRLKIEQIDLKEFDKSLDNYEVRDGIVGRQHMLQFRKIIVDSKGDKSFWEKDVPNLISLLDTSKEKIQRYRTDLSEIGGKNLQNEDIINLIKRGILTIETPISKTHKGEEFTGHLTSDGYLELEVNGISKKLSLRRAALYAWGSNPSPNQWAFWEAPDSNGEKQSLEYFKKLLNAKGQ